jgi:hypothetical protein
MDKIKSFLCAPKKKVNDPVEFKDVMSLDTILSAYTLSWMVSTNLEKEGVDFKEKVKNDQTNIALLCALLLTIWAGTLVSIYPDATTYDVGSQVVIFGGLWIATTFHFLAMINATILCVMIQSTKTNDDAHEFIERIGYNEIAPLIQFVAGATVGVIATVWFTYKACDHAVTYVVLTWFVLFGGIRNCYYYQTNVAALNKTLNKKQNGKDMKNPIQESQEK